MEQKDAVPDAEREVGSKEATPSDESLSAMARRALARAKAMQDWGIPIPHTNC
ncbi:MAG: hypothetical protein PHS53_00785 [Candidatus Pacebacteria bacterium]|nr:hypothetical protein [Candidatus Paceibacterota bacterium]MDD5356672.1 hypothetical protein [Candidatus Paceibacterota bacterium]